MALKAPVLCYPVSDLETLAPVGSCSSNVPSSSSFTTASVGDGSIIKLDKLECAYNSKDAKLRDCLQLRPGSTVGDVYSALKRGV